MRFCGQRQVIRCPFCQLWAGAQNRFNPGPWEEPGDQTASGWTRARVSWQENEGPSRGTLGLESMRLYLCARVGQQILES